LALVLISLPFALSKELKPAPKKIIQKRALIIHGWSSNSKEHWFPQEKTELEKMGYTVTVPDMPNTKLPKKDEWVKVINDFKPDENTVLIGHSLGTPTILHYLEQPDAKVGKVFLVAAFDQSLGSGYRPIDNFTNEGFDWASINKHFQKMYVLAEDHDPAVPLKLSQEVSEKTGGELLIVSGSNHFNNYLDLNLINSRLKS
jgi:predicted alpha/beta hydrolase family esterase